MFLSPVATSDSESRREKEASRTGSGAAAELVVVGSRGEGTHVCRRV